MRLSKMVAKVEDFFTISAKVLRVGVRAAAVEARCLANKDKVVVEPAKPEAEYEVKQSEGTG